MASASNPFALRRRRRSATGYTSGEEDEAHALTKTTFLSKSSSLGRGRSETAGAAG